MNETGRRLRVLYVVESFLQHSQTYIRTEIEALQKTCDVKIISVFKPNINCPNNFDFAYYDDFSSSEALIDYIVQWKPDVMHTHYWFLSKVLDKYAQVLKIPYTVRTHSFDVIKPIEELVECVPMLNSDYCLRIIAFPFLLDHLAKTGVKKEKLFPSYPLINYGLFHDEGPNGKAVMNTGACLPKKNMPLFIDVAAEMPDREFNLYPLGYDTDELKAYNKEKGGAVIFHEPLMPEAMPPEYKKHEWLLYTADASTITVGWPMAIAEAQASGVGVLMPNIREDLKEYIGGAGYIFNSVDEAKEIIAGEYPQEMRQRGFEQAKKSDVYENLNVLTDAWGK